MLSLFLKRCKDTNFFSTSKLIGEKNAIFLHFIEKKRKIGDFSPLGAIFGLGKQVQSRKAVSCFLLVKRRFRVRFNQISIVTTSACRLNWTIRLYKRLMPDFKILILYGSPSMYLIRP